MRILLASNNPHKAREFKRLFYPIEVVTPQEYGITFQCQERGHSFYENALAKAEACATQSRADIAIVADDSGICVPALQGAPGIYSARYGNERAPSPLDDAARTRLLWEQMQPHSDRAAFYVCAMVLYWSTTHLYLAQEEWHGEIAPHISSSTGGFGYDPLFYLPQLQCCAADLSDAHKNALSHRGKAVRALLKMLSHDVG